MQVFSEQCSPKSGNSITEKPQQLRVVKFQQPEGERKESLMFTYRWSDDDNKEGGVTVR